MIFRTVRFLFCGYQKLDHLKATWQSLEKKTKYDIIFDGIA